MRVLQSQAAMPFGLHPPASGLLSESVALSHNDGWGGPLLRIRCNLTAAQIAHGKNIPMLGLMDLEKMHPFFVGASRGICR